MRSKILAVAVLAALSAGTGYDTHAGESESTRPTTSATRYVQPDLRLESYDKVLIDELTFEYDEASAYRDENAQRRERICMGAAAVLHEAVRGRFAVVTDVGPGTVRLRTSIKDVRAEEKRRKFWQYTPVGLIKGRIDAASGANIALHSATIEIELVDAVTGRSLASIVDTDDYASWRDVVARLDWWVRHIVDDPRRWA